MGIFGKTTIGGTDVALSATNMNGTNYQMSNNPDQQLKSITVFCAAKGDPIRAAIYDVPDNIQTGNPGSLLWGSPAFVPEIGWNEIVIPEMERPRLIANHWCCLAVRVNGTTTKFSYDTGAANSEKYKTNLSDFYVDWPNPFPSPSNRNYQWSIYGTWEMAPSLTPSFITSRPAPQGFCVIVNGLDVTPDLLGATIKNTIDQIDILTFQLHDPKGKYIFGESALRNGQVIEAFMDRRLLYRGYLDKVKDNVDAERINQGVFSRGVGQQLNWTNIYDTYFQWRAEEIARDIAERARLKYLTGFIPQTEKTSISYIRTSGQAAIQHILEPERVSVDVTPAGDVVPRPRYKFFSGYAMTPSLLEGFNIGNITIEKDMVNWYCDYYTQIGGEALFPFPTGDEWTEDKADQWALFTGSGSVWDAYGGPVRSFYTRYTSSPLACRGVLFPKTKDLDYLVDEKWFTELRFWRISKSNYTGGSGYVHLHSTDSKYASKSLARADSWTETNIPLSSFTLNGGFKWATDRINWIEFYYCEGAYGGWVMVDGLHFWGKQIEYTAENPASRRLYGGPHRIPHKSFGSDPDLHDPNRAILLAENYVSDLNHGQPRMVIELDYFGEPDFRAGDWVWLSIPSRGIKDHLQVQEVTHTCKEGGAGYNCHLSIGGLPVHTARYFADIKSRLKSLESWMA